MMTFDEKLERQQRRSEREKQRHRYESSHEERTTEPKTRNGIVANCELLNFRSEPDRHNKENIIAVLKKGDRVEILGVVMDRDTGMLHVRIDDGREGYIASQFCKEV